MYIIKRVNYIFILVNSLIKKVYFIIKREKVIYNTGSNNLYFKYIKKELLENIR